MADTTLVQMRVPDDLLEAIDGARGDESRTAWMLAAAELALSAEAAAEPPAPAEAVPAAPPAGSGGVLAGGIPCDGVACSHSGCWQRDTRRYGNPDDFGGLILCAAHAEDAVGRRYQRPEAARARGLKKPA